MPVSDDRGSAGAPGASRSTTDLLAEADRLLEELPGQIESAKQERERSARLRKPLKRKDG